MKKELLIPETLHEVSLTNFANIGKIVEREDENVLIDSIHAILGVDRSLLLTLRQSVIERLGLKVVALLKADNVPVYTFNLGKVKFGMIPDFREGAMSYGEYIDLNSYIKRLDSGQRDLDSMARFLSVAFRPINKELGHGLYSIDEYVSSEKHYKEMLNAPAAVFLGAEAFFLNLRKDLATSFITYSKEMEAKYPQLDKTLIHTLGTTAVWQEWQMGIISKLINLLESRC